jgi:hypothetical protein
MAAVLTNSGIRFSDNTSLNSKYGIIPQSTMMLFRRSSAPTGWTKRTDSAFNNAACRIVTGNVSTGGNQAFTSSFAQRGVSSGVSVSVNGGNINNHTLSQPQIPAHNHPYQRPNASRNYHGSSPNSSVSAIYTTNGQNTGNRGGNGQHSHSRNGFSASGNFSTSVDFRVKYADCIFATFN